jgi:hypothetical protein
MALVTFATDASSVNQTGNPGRSARIQPKFAASLIELRTLPEDDEYEVEFYLRPALKILAVTLLQVFIGPLVIPLVIWVFGRPLANNLGLTLHRLYRFELAGFIWFAMMVTVHIFEPDFAYLYGGFDALAGLIVLARVTLVSLKYGYYKRSFLKKYFTDSMDLGTLVKPLLIPSWYRVPHEIAQTEVNEAYRKLKICHDRLVKFEGQLPADIEEFFKDKVRSANGRYDSQDLATTLINLYSNTQPVFSFRIGNVLCLGYILVPFVTNFLLYGSSGYASIGVLSGVYIAVSCAVCFYLGRILFLFIYIGKVDFDRKAMLMRQCSALISQTDAKFLLIKGLPQLDMTDPSTGQAWYFMRRVFLSFGKRYTARTFLYISILLPPCIGLVALLYLQLFNIVSDSMNIYFAAWIFMSLAILVLILLIINSAVSLVRFYDIHKDLLLTKVSEFLLEASVESKQDPVSIQHIDNVIARLDHDEVCRPQTILGLTVSKTLMGELIALLASGVLLALQQIVT